MKPFKPSRPLRVLQFITPSGFYGAERWVLAMANNCDSTRLLCDLVVTRESATQDLTVAELYPRHKGDVHYLDMRGRFDLRAIQQLCRIIREREIDIIHTHGYKSDLLGLVAARRTGITAVSTPHGFSGNVGFKLRTFIKLGTMALRYFDAVAPLSTQLLDDMRRFGVPDQRVQFIENGVDLTELEALRRDLQATPTVPESFHLGYVGQIIPRKGIRDLLQAFNALWQHLPHVRLSLVGDGAQRAEMEAFAATLPAAAHIEFLGFRSDRLELVRSFDAFALTSSLEGIPRCLMEAMAIGTPVVAYDIPGVDQLIRHEQTGLLAPLGDWQALAEQLQRLAHDATLAQQLAQQGRALVDQRFSAQRMATEYDQLFRRLLGQEETPCVA